MKHVAAMASLVLALAACGRREPADPVGPVTTANSAASPAERSSPPAPTPAFCLVEMVKHDGLSYSVWLAWQDGSGEWRHERAFGLGPGADARSAVLRAVPRTDYWLMLCDPGGFERDDFVHVGHVTGTAADPMPVVFAARNRRIRLVDEAD